MAPTHGFKNLLCDPESDGVKIAARLCENVTRPYPAFTGWMGVKNTKEQTMAAGFAASLADYASEKGANLAATLAQSSLTKDDKSG